MKFIIFYSVSFIFFGCVKEDPRLIKNHNTMLLTGNDTVLVDKLKLIKVEKDSIPFAANYNMDQSEIQDIFREVTRTNFNFDIINLDLYIKLKDNQDLKHWKINYSDVKYISAYYVKNDSLNFDFYDVVMQKKETYKRLSDASCSTFVMFLTNQCKYKNKALLSLYPSKKEMPKKNKILFSNKEDDILYKKEQSFFKNSGNID
ncbi:MAG: hypothetical protein ACK5M1_02105 [Xanthomarina gelatinilytica]|uniref:hypothetical protein n=1 Tax=Xanthomarina gelatinilytica TaxID=1137281 RepID=UPI003A8908C9